MTINCCERAQARPYLGLIRMLYEAAEKGLLEIASCGRGSVSY